MIIQKKVIKKNEIKVEYFKATKIFIIQPSKNKNQSNCWLKRKKPPKKVLIVWLKALKKKKKR